MELTGINTINKLILLFVFDKMEFPITENTIVEMCTSRNTWLTYMDCQHTLGQLIKSNFVYKSHKLEKSNYYSITPDGRMCISHFYTRIPASIRTEISEYIRDNRMTLRRKQEYFRHYYKNDDGTYTVVLKIMDPVQTPLEIKLIVATRAIAKLVFIRWEEKAAQLYYNLHELLIE